MKEILVKPPCATIGFHSGVGPIKFKSPIIDFDLRDCKRLKLGNGEHREAQGFSSVIISYSKVNKYSNDFCYVSIL